MDIYVIYNDDKQLERIRESDIKTDSLFHFIDERNFKSKKEAYKIKGHFASRLSPFIGIYKNDKAIKGFYSEASDDVISDLIEYLNKEK